MNLTLQLNFAMPTSQRNSMLRRASSVPRIGKRRGLAKRGETGSWTPNTINKTAITAGMTAIQKTKRKLSPVIDISSIARSGPRKARQCPLTAGDRRRCLAMPSGSRRRSAHREERCGHPCQSGRQTEPSAPDRCRRQAERGAWSAPRDPSRAGPEVCACRSSR